MHANLHQPPADIHHQAPNTLPDLPAALCRLPWPQGVPVGPNGMPDEFRPQYRQQTPLAQYSMLQYLTDRSTLGVARAPEARTGNPTTNDWYSACGPFGAERNQDWMSDLVRHSGICEWLARVDASDLGEHIGSPSIPAGEEEIVKAHLRNDLIKRVRRGLEIVETACPYLPNDQRKMYIGIAPTGFCLPVPYWRDREAYKKNNRFTPDALGYIGDGNGGLNLGYDPRANRLPGDIKPSWKVQAQQDLTIGAYYWAVYQVHFYMYQRGAAYGFLLTDKVLFCLRRTGAPGPIGPFHLPLEISTPIDVQFGFQNQNEDEVSVNEALRRVLAGEITAPLALFLLNCVASSDTRWKI